MSRVAHHLVVCAALVLGSGGAGAQSRIPKSWGACMYNGGYFYTISIAEVEAWCRDVAGLKPSGGGGRGKCMFEQGRAKVQRGAATKVCRG